MRYIPFLGKAAVRRFSGLALFATVALSMMQPSPCSAAGSSSCSPFQVQVEAGAQDAPKSEMKKSPRDVIRLRRLGGPNVFLGVFPQTLSDERAAELGLKGGRGVYVLKVVPGSPAETGGLKKGDVIIEFNGQPVVNNEQFRDYLRKCEPGKPVTLGVARDRQNQRVTVVPEKSADAKVFEINPRDGDFEFNFNGDVQGPLVDLQAIRPEIAGLEGRVKMFTMAFDRGRLGVRTQSLSDQLAAYFGVPGGAGVLVTEVTPDSAAEKAGLKAGDCIVKVGDMPVRSVGEIIHLLQKVEAGPVNLTVIRERQTLVLTANLEKRAETPAFAPFLNGPAAPLEIAPPQFRLPAPAVVHPLDWDDFPIVM
jgi:membrane-associated protease RseP (regulator of RpoE activity)